MHTVNRPKTRRRDRSENYDAAQPMSGGTAPTTAPTRVFVIDRRFSVVLSPEYNAILAPPSSATVGLTPKYRAATPSVPETPAKVKASLGVMSLRTTGRARVRVIRPSKICSRPMFNSISSYRRERAYQRVKNINCDNVASITA